jgi:hypothetical protein
MVLAQDLALDRENLAKAGLRAGQIALPVAKDGEVAERRGDRLGVVAEQPALDDQRLLEELLRFVVVTLRVEDAGQVVQALADLGALPAEMLAPQRSTPGSGAHGLRPSPQRCVPID